MVRQKRGTSTPFEGPRRRCLAAIFAMVTSISNKCSRQVDAFHLTPADHPNSPTEGQSTPSSQPTTCIRGFRSNGLSCIMADDMVRMETTNSITSSRDEIFVTSHNGQQDDFKHPLIHDHVTITFLGSMVNMQQVITETKPSDSIAVTTNHQALQSETSKLQRIREMLTDGALIMVNIARLMVLDQG